jgi:hypothetical protein
MNFKKWLDLQEAARWKSSDWTQDELLASKSLEKYAKEPYYIHLSPVPKLGMWPQYLKRFSYEKQPMGIYAYPGDYIRERLAGTHSTWVPFGADRKYIIVLKPKNPERILNLGDPEDLKHYDELVEKEKEYAWTPESGIKGNEFPQGKLTKDLKQNYDGVIDPGLGRLHSVNPTAAVFWGKHLLDLITILYNDLSGKDAKKTGILKAVPKTKRYEKSPYKFSPKPSPEQRYLSKIRPEDWPTWEPDPWNI